MKDHRSIFKSGLIAVLFAVASAAGLRAETVTVAGELKGEVDLTEIHTKLDKLDADMQLLLDHLTTPGSDTPGGDDGGGNSGGEDDPGDDPGGGVSDKETDLYINPSFYGERPIITGKRDGVYQVDPEYAALLSKYSGIRYLNWTSLLRWGVNTSWENRVNDDLTQDAPSDTGRWSSLDAKWHKTGLPLEAIIAVANTTKTDVWWTGPMQADADFFFQAGKLFAELLDPDLRVIIEVGNEVWDSGRGRPYHMGVDFEVAMRRYARDSAEKFAAFKAGGFPAERLTRVVGGNLHHYDVMPRHILVHLADDEYDAITCSGYFGNSAHKGEHWRTGKHGLNHSIRELNRYADLAESRNKKLLIYELNHHATDNQALAESDEVIDGVGTMIDTARARGASAIALFQGAGVNNDRFHWALYRPDLTPRRIVERLGLPTINN